MCRRTESVSAAGWQGARPRRSCDGERSADETALVSHETIISALEKALTDIDGLIDPMTHTLIDGVLRAEHDEAATITHRLGIASKVSKT